MCVYGNIWTEWTGREWRQCEGKVCGEVGEGVGKGAFSGMVGRGDRGGKGEVGRMGSGVV